MHIPKFGRIALVVATLMAAIAWLPAANAAPAGNLFAAEVDISERTKEAKRDATRRALAEVMIKVSGSRTIAREGNARVLLESAESYVQQFRYTPNGTILLGFDGRKLLNEMRVAGLPVWGSDRPATLMWLAVDYGNGDRQLITADNQGEVRREIETLAASRGIPLVWPLYDSTDRAMVQVADVWGGFDDNIIEASERYGTEAVLVARVARGASGPMYGSWELSIEGVDTNWRGGFGQSINRLADYYAERLSVTRSSGPASRLAMSITGLGNAAAYADAISSVEKLGMVDRLQVVQVNADQVVLDLTVRGDASQLKRALGLNRVLAPDADSSGTLAYRYTR